MYNLNSTLENYSFSEMILTDGFQIKKKKNIITLYEQKMIDNAIKYKFDSTYMKVINQILSFLNDEEEGDPVDFLNNLETLRLVLYNKYEKYLSKKELNKYLKNIRLLVNELNNKKIILMPKKVGGRRK